MADAQKDPVREAVLRVLIETERSLQQITIQCNKYSFTRASVLKEKYENDLFAELVTKIHATSLEGMIGEDYIVPVNDKDPDWAIVQLGNNYQFIKDTLESEHGKELLKAEYHPKTKSAFKRMITITLWHTLIYTELLKVDDPLLSNYVAELKSTVETIARSKPFALLHGQSLESTPTKIEELEKQEWWINAVGQQGGHEMGEQTRRTADAQNGEGNNNSQASSLEEENDLRVIAKYCSEKDISILDVLARKYESEQFAKLIFELYTFASRDSLYGDSIVPVNNKDSDWTLVRNNYDYMYNLVADTDVRELLKGKYHPKTRSAFKRLVTVVLWHVLIYTKTDTVHGPLLRHYAAELKSTVGTIPYSEPFAAMHGVEYKVYADVMKFLQPRLETIRELEKKDWWINTVVP